MHTLLPLVSFALVGCLLGSTPDPAPESRATGELFPAARQSIALASDGGGVPLERLARELERVSGARFVSGPDARERLARTTCGLHGPLEIAAAEAWSTTEALLAHHGFVLVPLQSEGVRIFGLEPAIGVTAPSLRGRAHQAGVEQIEGLAAHPALLVQTTIDTTPLDARALASSMRSLVGDPMTEQIVPLGDTSRLVLLGRAPQVAAWVRTLRAAGITEAR